MDWFIENREWLFSGVAIAIPLAIAGWAFSSKGQKQVQKGGKGSTNIQIGGSLNIEEKEQEKGE